ncbi:MAG: ABC transporter ATP-binding protein [Bullifex sp.]
MKNSPDTILYWFKKEAPILAAVTVTGIIYNMGLAAGPWFEGKLVQALADLNAGRAGGKYMLILCLCYVCVIVFVQAMRALKRLTVRSFANRIGRDLKVKLYRSLLSGRTGDGAGEMMTKIISDAEDTAEGMRKFTTELFDTGIALVSYLIMLFIYDWRLTLLTALFPPLSCLLAERLKKTVTSNTSACRESAARLNAMTLDRVSNALTYRICGMESERDMEYEKLLSDHERKVTLANVWESAMPPLYQVIALAGTVFIICFGSRNVLGTGWDIWDIAAFTTFFSCYLKLAVKASKAAKLFNSVQKAKVSWKRIKPYLKDPERTEAEEISEKAVLQAEDVSVSYTGHDCIFSNLTFTASPGEIIGVTGKVASGKSALGKMLTGELPFTGKLILGDTVYKAGEYKNGVSYMGHSPELISGTVRDNIAMGLEVDVMPYLKAVCIESEVTPDTLIGSGGVRLSGGQAERIALARTLCHSAPLIILDDPFSAVDRTTEEVIFRNIRTMTKESIIILISHRLSCFTCLDRVIFIDDGKATVSDHETLMRDNAEYRLLYETQEAGR